MQREQKYTALVLKKQSFGESDEIITFYTQEKGKIRCLAKSIKKPLAKLQQKLQSLFLVELRVASGSKLPKIISAEPVDVYSNILNNLESLKIAFLVIELVLKFTPDEQKNEQLYNSIIKFLNLLNSESTLELQTLGLAKFKIEILAASGLAIDFYPELEMSNKIYFNNTLGGFTDINSPGSQLVDKNAFKLFLNIFNAQTFSQSTIEFIQSLPELQSLLSQFIVYQLERKINSENFLTS